MSNGAPELPGFYFDEEKNRYFKIPDTGIPLNIRKLTPLPKEITEVNYLVGNSCKTIRSRELGNFHFPSHFERKMIGVKLMNYSTSQPEVSPFKDIFEGPVIIRDCIFTVSNTYFILSLVHRNKVPELLSLAYPKFRRTSLYTNPQGLIMDVDNFNKYNKRWLACVLLDKYNTSFIKVQHTIDNNDMLNFTIKLKKTALTCACYEDKLCYSEEYGALRVICGECELKTLPKTTLESEITKQTFTACGQLFLNGLRNGLIAAIGFRSGKRHFTIKPGENEKNVKDLRSLSDGNLIISRHVSTNDSIFLWDVRKLTDPVLHYTSIPHQVHKNTKKRFQVDEKERFLTCVNVDKIIRVWDIQKGNLVSSINSENEPITASYQDNWPLFGAKQGILCVGSEGLSWYGENGYNDNLLKVRPRH